ncbi:hypothetical protein MLC59_13145 [Marinobacter bryozoorum]|uniref:lipase secretion chaperone n=1 Tax=Marinobacter bryozoorum TaxID=256324 RepID=UPI0020044FCC|nr:hypothetical protein [Marinobacter bryozoorum]
MSTRIPGSRKPAPPPGRNNRKAMIGASAGVLGAVAIAIWAGAKVLITDEAPAQAPAQVTEADPPSGQPAQRPSGAEAQTFSGSLLTASEPEASTGTTEADAEPELTIPFQIEQVAHALSQVDIDENGDVVINEAAQTVLEQAFMDARVTVDEKQLEAIKAMIAAGLEGPAGTQAAEVAEKFYRYSNAFREISDTLAMHSDPGTLRNDYRQVERLRRTHLGPELAEQLYGREEQLTRYTLDVMEIQADPDLTPEQRTEKQREVASRYPEVLPVGNEDGNATAGQATN